MNRHAELAQDLLGQAIRKEEEDFERRVQLAKDLLGPDLDKTARRVAGHLRAVVDEDREHKREMAALRNAGLDETVVEEMEQHYEEQNNGDDDDDE